MVRCAVWRVSESVNTDESSSPPFQFIYPSLEALISVVLTSPNTIFMICGAMSQMVLYMVYRSLGSSCNM
jgi:hypothetical protein